MAHRLAPQLGRTDPETHPPGRRTGSGLNGDACAFSDISGMPYKRNQIEEAIACIVAPDSAEPSGQESWRQLARKMHRLGRISCKVLIFRGIKFATQISAAF